MQTYRLPHFRVLDPQPNDILIEDIAHHLAQAVRWGGAGIRFLSVAEHSVHLARWWMAHGTGSLQERIAIALWLLLHDGPEAYLHDVVRPVKRTLSGYREAEERLMLAICLRFGLQLKMPREVKALDNRIVIDERAQNMAPSDVVFCYGGETEPLGVTLEYWSPERAENEFLTLFAELTGEVVTMPRSILSAAEAQTAAGGDGWQPISTVPEGVEIVVRGGRTVFGDEQRGSRITIVDDRADLYRPDGTLSPLSPTTWHPAPTPPADAGAKGGPAHGR